MRAVTRTARKMKPKVRQKLRKKMKLKVRLKMMPRMKLKRRLKKILPNPTRNRKMVPLNGSDS